MNLIEQLFNDFNAKYLEEAKANAKANGIDLGIQDKYTPIDKIEKATGFRFADYITSNTKSVGVLFNTEFIDYFIKELPQNYINNIEIVGNQKGSVRLDVFDTTTNQVYDYKFVINLGKGLSTTQMNKIIKHGPNGLSIEDIHEVNPH